jgi:hypothetical protein
MRPYAVSVEEGERINNVSIRCSSRNFIVGIIRIYVYPQCGGCQSPAFFKNKTAKLHAFKYDDPTIPVVASPQMGQQPLTGPVVTDLWHKPINQSVPQPVWSVCLNIQ